MKKFKHLFSKDKSRNKKEHEQTSIESRASSTTATIEKEKLVAASKDTDCIRNFLLIGRSGNGKSTLANVITNTNNFKESEKSISETKIVQSEEFTDEENERQYRIIDTPGIGDTKLKQNEVLDIIAKAVYLVRDGVSQVFFVSRTRFDQDEMVTYNLLRSIIFDQEITKHTTIVRTRFQSFRNEKECDKDIELMMKKSDNLAEIIRSCNKVIHVDNPSIDIDDEGEIELNEYKRGKSRDKIIKHLQNCQSSSYKPPKLQQLSDEIAEDYFQYLKKKEELARELEKIRVNSSSPVTDYHQSLTSTKTSVKDDDYYAETQENNKVKKGNATSNNALEFSIVERIAKLESKKERLQREIKEKEELIRQKVLKHIFNNYENTSNEPINEVFIDNLIGEHDWTTIHNDFTKEVIIKWLTQGFNFQQAYQWAVALQENDFKPNNDASFCAWLRDVKQLTVTEVERLTNANNKINTWRKEYLRNLDQEVQMLDAHHQQLNEEASQDLIQVQEYFNRHYPREERHKVEVIDIRNQNLTGTLDLSDFINLEFLACSYGNKLTSLNLTNCHKLLTIYCGDNQLSTLGLTSLDKLEILSCRGNYLDRFDYSTLNPDKLTYLNVSNNNLPKQDINVFRRFVNLTHLWIGSIYDDHTENSHNRFFGSLAALKNLNKLYSLNISNTDVTGNLGDLSPNLKVIYCANNYRPESRVKELEAQLRNSKDFAYVVGDMPGKYNSTILENAQKWLNRIYHKETRNSISCLAFNHLNLTGSLSLTEFNNLKVLHCQNNQLGNLDVDHCPELQVLKCDNNQLASINLSQNKALETIDLQNNQLVNLSLNNATNLRALNCGGNKLTKAPILHYPERLTHYSVFSNNFSKQDLVFLTKLPNLIHLAIGGNNFVNAEPYLRTYLASNKRLEYLDLHNLQLTGFWKFAGFPNLREIYLGNNNLSNLIFLNTPNLVKIDCQKNQLSDLDLTNCWKLIDLHCSQNQLAQLLFSTKSNLQRLRCRDNFLTKLNWSVLNPYKLTTLDITSNNFFENDLSFLVEFTNLKELYLGNNNQTKIDQGIVNRWCGSLVPLQNMKQLEKLGIENTNLNSDVELLPISLEDIYAKNMPAIAEKMKNFKDKYGSYNYQAWRVANQNLIAQVEQNTTRY